MISMTRMIQWFVRLVRRDMELFEVDGEKERRMFQNILHKMKDG